MVTATFNTYWKTTCQVSCRLTLTPRSVKGCAGGPESRWEVRNNFPSRWDLLIILPPTGVRYIYIYMQIRQITHIFHMQIPDVLGPGMTSPDTVQIRHLIAMHVYKKKRERKQEELTSARHVSPRARRNGHRHTERRKVKPQANAIHYIKLILSRENTSFLGTR